MTKALGMIETKGLVGSLEAADVMVKSADVQIVSQAKTSGGLVSILVEGDVGAVQAAVAAGVDATAKIGELVSHHVIPHPDEAIIEFLTNNDTVNKTKGKNVKKSIGNSKKEMKTSKKTPSKLKQNKEEQ